MQVSSLFMFLLIPSLFCPLFHCCYSSFSSNFFLSFFPHIRYLYLFLFLLFCSLTLLLYLLHLIFRSSFSLSFIFPSFLPSPLLFLSVFFSFSSFITVLFPWSSCCAFSSFLFHFLFHFDLNFFSFFFSFFSLYYIFFFSSIFYGIFFSYSSFHFLLSFCTRKSHLSCKMRLFKISRMQNHVRAKWDVQSMGRTDRIRKVHYTILDCKFDSG